MQETMKFLLSSLGISNGQLQIVRRIRTIVELDDLSVDDDTHLPLTSVGGAKVSNIVLTAKVSPEQYTGYKITEILKRYGLTPTGLKDYSYQRGIALIHVSFADYSKEDGVKSEVTLYLREKNIKT